MIEGLRRNPLLLGMILLFLDPISPASAQDRLLSKPPLPAGPSGGDVWSWWVAVDGTVVYTAEQDVEDVLDFYSAPADGSTPPIKLNRPVGAQAFLITSPRITPDAQRVVYFYDEDTSGVNELYSVPIDGSASSFKLNDPLPVGGRIVGTLQVTPDSLRVVYMADQETDEIIELYSARVDGSESSLGLSGSLVAGGDVDLFEVAGTSAVVFRADKETDDVLELFRAPVDGSAAPVKLSGSMTGGGDVSSFVVALDGSAVLYRADQDTNDVFELYSVPSSGSAPPIKLNAPLVPQGDVSGFVLTPDASRAVYMADQDADSVNEIYGVPSDGSAGPTKLNGLLVSGGDVGLYRISPDGARVAYLADQDTDGVLELYAGPIDGSAPPVKLNPPLVAPLKVISLVISPDGSRVVYSAFQDLNSSAELYSVPIDGSASPIKLNPPYTSPYQDIDSIQISPDSTRVVYSASQDALFAVELYSVPIDGSASSVRLNAPFAAGSTVKSFVIVPDGTRVVYRADESTYDHIELFGAPIDGSAPRVRISGNLSPVQAVSDFEVTPDGSRALYRSNQPPTSPGVFGIPGARELYSVLSDGSGSPTKVHFPLQPDQEIRDFEISSDGSRVVYRYGGIYSGFGLRLFSAEPDGSSEPVELTDFQSPLGYATRYQIGPENRVVFLGDADVFDDFGSDLWTVPIDGGSSPVKLNGPLVQDGAAIAFEVRSDRVVYVADETVDEAFELHSVPLDQSEPPLLLSGALVLGGDVQSDVRIDPDGTHAVYRADAIVDDVFELWSVPVAGAAGPTKLSGALTAGGDVQAFRISPDGERVVYLADQDANGVFELYTVGIEGGPSLAKVNDALSSLEDVASFQISPDGSRIVYVADQDLAGVLQLYSAPIDAASSAVELAGPLVLGGDVDPHFFFSTDGTRVVYVADQVADDVCELWSVPTAGEASPTKLSGVLVSGGDVQADLEIVPGGRYVAYRADEDVDGILELFAAPIDGRRPSRKMSAPLVPGRNVQTGFRVTAGAHFALYRADALLDQVFELFTSFVDRRPLRAAGPPVPR